MKKPQSELAKRRREASARTSRNVCPVHGEKLSKTALLWRCGCSTDADAAKVIYLRMR